MDLLKSHFRVKSGGALASRVEGPNCDPQMWKLFDWARRRAVWDGGYSVYVDRAERVKPGSSRILLHPAWRMLYEGEIDQKMIDDGLWALPDALRSKFFVSVDGHLVRKRKVLQLYHLDDLWTFPSFDGLAVTMLLMAEAKLVCSPVLREAAFEEYEIVQPRFAQVPGHSRIYPYLFTRIDAMFQRWVFTDIRRRVDIRMRWDKEFWATRVEQPVIKYPKLLGELDVGPPCIPQHIKAIARVRRGSLLQLYM